MNYAEIKQNIISLGFAEESDYEEFEELGYTYDSINRAITQIGNHFPFQKTYQFDVDDTDEGILFFDMTLVDPNFLSFGDTPVMYERDGQAYWKKFSDYDVETETTLVINADDTKGSFRIYYNALCTQINQDTADTFVPELPLKAHHLIPLLASYYLWLDDEYDKAMLYKQDYETALSLALQTQKKTKAIVYPDSEWGVV